MSGGPPVAAGRKPDWLKIKVPSGENWLKMTELLERRGLTTVCDAARCPNKAECWGEATATFMVLGATCTRNCRFCACTRSRKGDAVNPKEPTELAEAVAELELKYVVITSVDRDDLPDRGAAHFAACIREVKARNPGVGIEVLIPDYREGEISPLLKAGPDVIAHNLEVVERLQGIRDVRASWAASLHTLRLAAEHRVARGGGSLVKSSLMLGLGETESEVHAAMDALVGVGCKALVLGQYLQPTAEQLPVVEYLTPEAFEAYAEVARSKGFESVVSAPLARTSYHAREAFVSHVK